LLLACLFTLFAQYESHMADLEKADKDLYNRIKTINPATFCNFALGANRHGIYTNQAAECANSFLKELRNCPLLKSFEGYVAYVIKKYVDGLVEAQEACKMHVIAPLYAGNATQSMNYAVSSMMVTPDTTPALPAELGAEVTYTVGSYKVNLHQHTCSCGMWTLDTLPCQHAWASIAMYAKKTGAEMKTILTDYCPQYYCSSSLLETYSVPIVAVPINVEELVADPLLKPPVIQVTKGRPRKERFRPSSEAYGRPRKRMNCGACGEAGHNRRGCKKPAEKATPTSANADKARGGPRSDSDSEADIGDVTDGDSTADDGEHVPAESSVQEEDSRDDQNVASETEEEDCGAGASVQVSKTFAERTVREYPCDTCLEEVTDDDLGAPYCLVCYKYFHQGCVTPSSRLSLDEDHIVCDRCFALIDPRLNATIPPLHQEGDCLLCNKPLVIQNEKTGRHQDNTVECSKCHLYNMHSACAGIFTDTPLRSYCIACILAALAYASAQRDRRVISMYVRPLVRRIIGLEYFRNNCHLNATQVLLQVLDVPANRSGGKFADVTKYWYEGSDFIPASAAQRLQHDSAYVQRFPYGSQQDVHEVLFYILQRTTSFPFWRRLLLLQAQLVFTCKDCLSETAGRYEEFEALNVALAPAEEGSVQMQSLLDSEMQSTVSKRCDGCRCAKCAEICGEDVRTGNCSCNHEHTKRYQYEMRQYFVARLKREVDENFTKTHVHVLGSERISIGTTDFEAVCYIFHSGILYDLCP